MPPLIAALVALSILVLATGETRAATPAEVARKSGLIGRWAVNCAQPVKPGANNSFFYEITADGRLVHRRDSDLNETFDVVGLTPQDDMLVLRTVFPKYRQTRENGVALQPDGSIRSIYNRDQNGNYSVRDGRLTGTGAETLPLYHCDGASSLLRGT